MPEIVKHCPLCGHTNYTQFDQRSFREQTVVNQICSYCGLVFQSPRMTSSELDAFYDNEYRQLYQDQEGPDAKDLAVQAGRALALLEFTKPGLKELNKHLDIGCSAGLLMEAFIEAYNCQSTGVEPGASYRDYARSKGLTVYDSLEETPDGETPAGIGSHEIAPYKYDLISMAHVLEHLPYPVEYLTTLRAHYLSSEGLLLVEVPYLYCHDCFEVAHTVSYSAHTLSQTLQKAGFDITAYMEHGTPRSEILPLYLTMLARPASSIQGFHLAPENNVKLKRQLGLFRRRVVTRLSPQKAWIPVSKFNQTDT